MAVAALVLEHGGNEDEAIAALLHDAVEDQGGLPTLESIRERFGDRVADIVHALSDSLDANRSKDGDRKHWRGRKERYLAHLAAAPRAVHRIAAADKLHNLRTLVADLRQHGEPVWERFNAPKEDQLWLYRAFYRTIAAAERNTLVDELADALLDLEAAAVQGGLAKAIAIAARAHLLQADKAGAAYILHPLRLMAAVEGESAKIAAVLHDVVEDGEGWTFDRLEREGFPGEVVTAVRHLTKREAESYDDFVARAARDPIARAVKRADLEDNMDLRRLASLTDKDVERVKRYHRAWSRLARQAQ